ncbi:MAG: hypothetical protein AB8B95_06030 [Pseudohongiellaceae bacterium]
MLLNFATCAWRPYKALTVLAFFAGISSGSAQAAETLGQTPSGAFYTISVPDGWKNSDGLVIWNHGYQGYTQTQPESNPSLGPLETLVLAQGYALAASSFSQTGWALFNSHIDNQELYDAFVELHGVPDTLYIQGASMGGTVSIRDLEAGLIPEADGALLICGATAGANNWYNAFDLRVIYEASCNGVSNSELPTKNWYDQPEAITGELTFLRSLSSCVGIFPDEISSALADFARSNAQTERLNQILSLSGVSKEFLLLDLGYAVFEIPNLVNDNQKLAGLKPFGNAAVDYGDEEVNLSVRREVALPSARSTLLNNYTPSGNIGSTKILSIHTSGDGLVKVENQKVLGDLVPPSQYSSVVVVEDEPSHCGFTENEVVSAWNSLRGWVEGADQPSANVIKQRCLMDNGNDELCRFDPNYQYSGQLLSFPRNQQAAVLGHNEYLSDTRAVSLQSLKVVGETENYDLTLSALSENLTTFKIDDIKLTAAPNSWQHQGLFFPANSLLYIPELIVGPTPLESQLYDLYMELSSKDGGNTFTLIEYEPSTPQ